VRSFALGVFLAAVWICAVGAFNCAHVTPFEACVRDHAEQMAASRVQAAIACHGDHACIEESVIDDVQTFAGMAEQCRLDAEAGTP
jgi:hypothetical protein